MTAQTKVSAKGQVVIPKDVRDRLQWAQGQTLDVLETPQGVLLKPVRSKRGLSLEQAISEILKIVRYEGPPVTIDEMNEAIEEVWASGGPKNW